jgi:sialidase-1
MKLPMSLILSFLLLSNCAATGATFRKITDTGPWGDYEAFPDVCRTANGDLYVVFYAGYGHVSNPREDLPRGGAIYGLRSSDEGKTWSKPILVVDSPEDDRDPHVRQLANGDLLASFFDSVYYTEDGKRKRRAQTYVARSTDGGATWKDPVVVTTPYRDEAGIGRRIFVSGPVAQLEGAHVVQPIYYEPVAGHYVTSVIHSDDFGHTWTHASPVDPEASLAFSYGFCEASIARVSDGRLIILMRPGMHQAYSSDEGRTWTKATQLPHRGDAPTVMMTSEDLLLVAHRHPGTAVTISGDDGATWGRPNQIDTVGGAYPGLVELSDGSILCIYYEEGKASSIRQAVFRVERAARLEDLEERWPSLNEIELYSQ